MNYVEEIKKLIREKVTVYFLVSSDSELRILDKNFSTFFLYPVDVPFDISFQGIHFLEFSLPISLCRS